MLDALPPSVGRSQAFPVHLFGQPRFAASELFGIRTDADDDVVQDDYFPDKTGNGTGNARGHYPVVDRQWPALRGNGPPTDGGGAVVNPHPVTSGGGGGK